MVCVALAILAVGNGATGCVWRGAAQEAGTEKMLNPKQGKGTISEAEAVKIAERFVAENGYTDLPATRQGDALSHEAVDDYDPQNRLRHRANTLERKACGVYEGNVWTKEPGWTVVFCFTGQSLPAGESGPPPDIGRPVLMDAEGANVKIFHLDIGLDGPGFKRLK
jgi:hypothetical protein